MLLVVGTKVYKDQMLTEFPTLKLWKCVGINFPILCQWRMCCMVQLDGRNGESLFPYLQAALPYLGSEKLVRTVPLEALLQLKMAIGTWHTYNLWMQTEDPSSPASCSPSRIQMPLRSSQVGYKRNCPLLLLLLRMSVPCSFWTWRLIALCCVIEPVDIIHLDFQKAFDTVPHQRLLKKN